MREARFYSSELNTETYDLGVGRGAAFTGEDVAFYRALALASGPRVLELGCGTGRVTIELAQAGLDATGLDNSPGMLRQAVAKAQSLSADVGSRLHFVEGDMTEFHICSAFDTVVAPARAFAFLLTVYAQRACLARVYEHLRPGGVLSIHLFDPRLDLCVPGISKGRTESAIDPATGQTVKVEIVSRENDALAQTLHEVWRFTELDESGSAIRVAEEDLRLRWTYRHEMHHLLELAGFEGIVEQSDFRESPPKYGAEQVWTCRRPEA